MGNRRETSNTLARRALVHTFSLALAGAGLGTVAILRGTVAGLEIVVCRVLDGDVVGFAVLPGDAGASGCDGCDFVLHSICDRGISDGR